MKHKLNILLLVLVCPLSHPFLRQSSIDSTANSLNNEDSDQAHNPNTVNLYRIIFEILLFNIFKVRSNNLLMKLIQIFTVIYKPEAENENMYQRVNLLLIAYSVRN